MRLSSNLNWKLSLKAEQTQIHLVSSDHRFVRVSGRKRHDKSEHHYTRCALWFDYSWYIVYSTYIERVFVVLAKDIHINVFICWSQTPNHNTIECAHCFIHFELDLCRKYCTQLLSTTVKSTLQKLKHKSTTVFCLFCRNVLQNKTQLKVNRVNVRQSGAQQTKSITFNDWTIDKWKQYNSKQYYTRSE